MDDPQRNTCPYCGDELTNPRRVWCGKPSCKKERDRDRIRQFHERVKRETGRAYKPPCRKDGNKHAAVYEHICPWCGKTLKNHKRKEPCHCSVDCWRASLAFARGETFSSMPGYQGERCDLPARHPVVLLGRAEYKRVFVGGKCRRCGETFVAWAEGGEASFCSRNCLRQWHKEKRRAAKRGVTHHPYRRSDIFERDAWRCHICGKKVKRGAGYLHPLSPTIDHLIPLAAGGSDAADNVSCAHRQCNSVKSHTGAAQLLLMG